MGVGDGIGSRHLRRRRRLGSCALGDGELLAHLRQFALQRSIRVSPLARLSL